MGVLKMDYFSTLRTSASGLSAQRQRMNVISNNIANVETTRTAAGGPYRRQQVVFSGASFETPLMQLVSRGRMDAMSGGRPAAGVRVAAVAEDRSPNRLVYQPNHPDANANGYVEMPNVNIVTEMIDMMSATRSYEANVTAMNAAKAMALKALEIGRA
jgi:flagellar basal-body rod protein FlgC